MDWKLADAKNRLSELVTKATTEGPQLIHRRDETVVVLAEASYRALLEQPKSFKDWLFNGPNLEGLDLERDRSPERELEL